MRIYAQYYGHNEYTRTAVHAPFSGYARGGLLQCDCCDPETAGLC
jgi:hypothetical protein